MEFGEVSRRRVLRAIGGFVGVGVFGYVSSRSTRAQSGEAWSQYGYDDANTRHAPENTGPVTDISPQWAVETGEGVSSSPAVADGTVYVGSYDDNVYALDAADGTKQWTFQMSNDVGSAPAVADGIVYVGKGDDSVYALDAADGTEQWAFDTGFDVYSAPAVADGVVYVGSYDNNVYALNAADGTEQWAFETGERVYSSPAVVDSTVYVGSHDNNVYAIEGSPGTPKSQPTDDSGPGFGLLSAAVGAGVAGLARAVATEQDTDD